MKNFFILLSLITIRLFSNDSTAEELASLHGDSSALVYDCVNAVTGDFVFHQQDCIVKGAEPIYLPRQYISREVKNFSLRSQIVNHSLAKIEFNGGIKAYIPEPTGIVLMYNAEEGSTKIDRHGRSYTVPLNFHAEPSQLRRGLVHQSDSMYHPVTNKAVYDEQTLKVLHTDGSYRVYFFIDRKRYAKDPLNVFHGESVLLRLDHERLANGRFIKYHWKEGNKMAMLESIETLSPQNTLLAKVEVDVKDEALFTVNTSNSQQLEYTYKYIESHAFLASIKTPEYPEETIEYNKQWRLRERAFPDGRRLKIKYYDDGKVKHLIGPDQILCTFEYSHGHTTVKDYDGNRTHYHFDAYTLRLEKIEFYDKNNKLIRVEQFAWDNNGNLLHKTVGLDQHENQLFFKYDDLCRVVTKSRIGPITDGKKDEVYTIYYTYNDQNQLVEEAEDNRLKTTYAYLSGTNLPISKITKKDGCILNRTTYAYNEDHVLVCETIDDGPDFTMCHIKRITPRAQKPFNGLPEIIAEYYQDGNLEILLRKTELTYDKWGNVTTKTVYDNENKFRYKGEVIYNAQGQIRKEIDPEGYVTTYAYDKNGNKTLEVSPLGLKTAYTYDKLNHCTSKREEKVV
ncbi:MAG: hypothetical protein K1000chlam2_00554 [Chlamydiae bacterium]|nr:hypothetical protein [Chlamydiota bacterium]